MHPNLLADWHHAKLSPRQNSCQHIHGRLSSAAVGAVGLHKATNSTIARCTRPVQAMWVWGHSTATARLMAVTIECQTESDTCAATPIRVEPCGELKIALDKRALSKSTAALCKPLCRFEDPNRPLHLQERPRLVNIHHKSQQLMILWAATHIWVKLRREVVVALASTPRAYLYAASEVQLNLHDSKKDKAGTRTCYKCPPILCAADHIWVKLRGQVAVALGENKVLRNATALCMPPMLFNSLSTKPGKTTLVQTHYQCHATTRL